MKYYVVLLLSFLLFSSCAKNSLQCSDMKPLKHKKYRVSNRNRKSIKRSSSSSTQTGKTKKVAQHNSILNDNVAKADESKPQTNVKNLEEVGINELKSLDAEQNIDEPSIEKEETVEEKSIIYSSNIERLTYIKAENQETQFDPKIHTRFQETLYEFQENTIFFQSILYNNIKTDLNHIELGTILNHLVSSTDNNTSQAFVIYVPTNNKSFAKSNSNNYNIVHLVEGKHYEIFKQNLSGTQAIIQEEKLTQNELNQQIENLNKNRVTAIVQHLESLGVPSANISIKNTSWVSSIIIEVK